MEPDLIAAIDIPLDSERVFVVFPNGYRDPFGFTQSETRLDGLNKRQRKYISQSKAQRLEAAIYCSKYVGLSVVSAEGSHEYKNRAKTKMALDELCEKLATLRSFLGENAGCVSSFLEEEPEGRAASFNLVFFVDSQENWRIGSTKNASERFAVKSGGITHAIMINGNNSNQPGQVIAQVSGNIYDTSDGYNLLIPQGTRLVGSYSSDILFGQSVFMLRWDRLILPDASTLDIPGMARADQMGYSGFKDKVNCTDSKLFCNAFMLSLISAGYLNCLPETNNNNVNTTAVIRMSVNIQPTIEVGPGYRFNATIDKDIIFNNSCEKMAHHKF